MSSLSADKHLLSNKFHGVFIFHTKLNQCQSHQHRRPTHDTAIKCISSIFL